MSGALNSLIFRDAKNAEYGKIAPNWNVSGTRDFSFCQTKFGLLRQVCLRVADNSSRIVGSTEVKRRIWAVMCE
jgi:hypothetical protein